MINVLICAFKSGDVLSYSLPQLIEESTITRVLLADGPHLGNIKPGYKADKPTVKEVVDSLNSPKVFYQYTDDCPTRSMKNNRILKNVTKDCEWILNVDSDEVYHEDDLKKMAAFLKNGTEYDRYEIKTINPYLDFHHEFQIPDWKPRLYRWFPGAGCKPKHDRMHQYVDHPKQRRHKKGLHGVAPLPTDVAQIYHLNALRSKDGVIRRVHPQKDGSIVWKGGNQRFESKVYDLDISKAPKTIRESGKDTL